MTYSRKFEYQKSLKKECIEIDQAIATGDLEAVKRLVNENNINNVLDNHIKLPPLIAAVTHQQLAIVEYFLSLKTIQIDFEGGYGDTALCETLNTITLLPSVNVKTCCKIAFMLLDHHTNPSQVKITHLREKHYRNKSLPPLVEFIQNLHDFKTCPDSDIQTKGSLAHAIACFYGDQDRQDKKIEWLKLAVSYQNCDGMWNYASHLISEKQNLEEAIDLLEKSYSLYKEKKLDSNCREIQNLLFKIIVDHSNDNHLTSKIATTACITICKTCNFTISKINNSQGEISLPRSLARSIVNASTLTQGAALTKPKFLSGLNILHGINDQISSPLRAIKIFEDLMKEAEITQNKNLLFLATLETGVAFMLAYYQNNTVHELGIKACEYFAQASNLVEKSKVKAFRMRSIFFQSLFLHHFNDITVQYVYNQLKVKLLSHSEDVIDLNEVMQTCVEIEKHATEIKEDRSEFLRTTYHRVAKNAEKMNSDNLAITAYKKSTEYGDIDAALQVAKILQLNDQKISEALDIYENAIDHAAHQQNAEKLIEIIKQMIALKKTTLLLPFIKERTDDLLLNSYMFVGSNWFIECAKGKPDLLHAAHEIAVNELSSTQVNMSENNVQAIHSILQQSGITDRIQKKNEVKLPDSVPETPMSTPPVSEPNKILQIQQSINKILEEKTPANIIRKLILLGEKVEPDSAAYTDIEKALIQTLKEGEEELKKTQHDEIFLWQDAYVKSIFYLGPTKASYIDYPSVIYLQKQAIHTLEDMLIKYRAGTQAIHSLYALYFYGYIDTKIANRDTSYLDPCFSLCLEVCHQYKQDEKNNLMVNAEKAFETRILDIENLIKLSEDTAVKEKARLLLAQIKLIKGNPSTNELQKLSLNDHLSATYQLAKKFIEHKSFFGRVQPQVRRGLYLATKTILLASDPEATTKGFLSQEELLKMRDYTFQFLTQEANKKGKYQELARWYLSIANIADKLIKFKLCDDILITVAEQKTPALEMYYDVVNGMQQALGASFNTINKITPHQKRTNLSAAITHAFKPPQATPTIAPLTTTEATIAATTTTTDVEKSHLLESISTDEATVLYYGQPTKEQLAASENQYKQIHATTNNTIEQPSLTQLTYAPMEFALSRNPVIEKVMAETVKKKNNNPINKIISAPSQLGLFYENLHKQQNTTKPVKEKKEEKKVLVLT